MNLRHYSWLNFISTWNAQNCSVRCVEIEWYKNNGIKIDGRVVHEEADCTFVDDLRDKPSVDSDIQELLYQWWKVQVVICNESTTQDSCNMFLSAKTACKELFGCLFHHSGSHSDLGSRDGLQLGSRFDHLIFFLSTTIFRWKERQGDMSLMNNHCKILNHMTHVKS